VPDELPEVSGEAAWELCRAPAKDRRRAGRGGYDVVTVLVGVGVDLTRRDGSGDEDILSSLL